MMPAGTGSRVPQPMRGMILVWRIDLARIGVKAS
jgi:hypothetical protein